MNRIVLRNAVIGPDEPAWIVAELGINHNGSIDLAKELIRSAAYAGCNAVKLQKRTVDIVYTAAELASRRRSPFGITTGELKRGLEFSVSQYTELGQFANMFGLTFFASVWDESSVDDLISSGIQLIKVPSACLTNWKLLQLINARGVPVIISTGMSSEEDIDTATKILNERELALLHTVSCYPTPPAEANLRKLTTLQAKFPAIPIGYSGHELGYELTLASVALGARIVERHITMSRNLWGTDQAISLEPNELRKMVDAIRLVESGLGDGHISVRSCEQAAMLKLRRT